MRCAGMLALALAAVLTVHDIDWDNAVYDFVDTDGVPFLAGFEDRTCEGELADGHVLIYVTYSFVDRDGGDVVLFRSDIFYDDGHSITEWRFYTVRDGRPVRLATIRDDRAYGVLTSVTVEEQRILEDYPKVWVRVERTRFRTRMVTAEIWVWDDGALVERKDLRAPYPIPVGH